MKLLLLATLVLYACASALYLSYVLGAAERVAQAARAILVLAVCVHLAEIGALCTIGRHPVSGAPEVLSFVAWLICGAFAFASFRSRIAAVGAFVAPAALLLLLGARLAPTMNWSPGAAKVLGEIHISLATLGIAAFTLAAAASAFYLVTEGQIKHQRFGRLFDRAPALDTLDKMANRAVRVGFPLFTVGLVLGALWASRLPAGESRVRPEYVASVTAWCAFAALLLARTTAGWRGRRAAFLSLFGFAISALVLVSYLSRGLP